MKGRTLALFLLVYLTLDLANPFMPGAVTFVDGRLEVIDAGRPPGTELPIRDVARGATPHGEPTLAQPSPRPAVTGENLRRWWIPPRRAVSIAPNPDPSSDDH